MSHPTILLVAKLKDTEAVTDLVSTRVWPDLRHSETLPAITYEALDDSAVNTANGTTTTSRITITLTLWADDRSAARALAAAVRTALSGWNDENDNVWHLDHEEDVPAEQSIPDGQDKPTVSAIEQHYVLHYTVS